MTQALHPASDRPSNHWTDICPLDAIVPDTGVCALVGGIHVAVFRIGSGQLYALDNVDPRSGASVLARGLVGNLGDRLVVASPLYKEHFDLTSGECLQTPTHSVRSHRVRLKAGRVQVALGGSSLPGG